MRRSPRVSWVESQVRQRYAQARILDVGFVGAYSEPFLHLAFRRQMPHAYIVGADMNVSGVLSLHLPDTVAADGKQLPFKDGSFDAILCLELLEHLYDPVSVLVEFWRLLRVNGELVISTPNAWAWGNFLQHWIVGSLRSRMHRDVYRHYLGDGDHKQFYDPLSLMNILDDTGFETIALTTKNHAVPMLRRWVKSCELLDWQFYPMDRLGYYLCLIVKKTHVPRRMHK
jgi:2-polyprenyl-3-methyl-5-hydroxy-6-metoxy-1,4-benzoquinol methylase